MEKIHGQVLISINLPDPKMAKLPLCEKCTPMAGQTYLVGDCCAYGSVSKLVSAMKQTRDDAEMDLARARMEASSLQGTKSDAQKQLGDTSRRLKEAEETIRRLESELKKSQETIKRRMAESEAMRLELDKLKAEKAGDKMEVTEANAQPREKPFPISIVAAGDKTMKPLRDDVLLWEEFGGLGALGLWTTKMETVSDCCNRVRRYLEDEPEGEIHVLIMAGSKDVEKGVPLGLDQHGIAKNILEPITKLRIEFEQRIKSISMCSLIEHPDCPNNNLVNNVLRQSVEVCRGIVSVLNHTLVSSDHRYLDQEATVENPYAATYTKAGYEVIKDLLTGYLMNKLNPDQVTLQKIQRNKARRLELIEKKAKATHDKAELRLDEGTLRKAALDEVMAAKKEKLRTKRREANERRKQKKREERKKEKEAGVQPKGAPGPPKRESQRAGGATQRTHPKDPKTSASNPSTSKHSS